MFDSLRPHGLCSPWNSPAQNIGGGSLSLLQGIFPTQGSNPGLLHYRWILYQLSHKGDPRIQEWVVYPFSIRSAWPRNRIRVSCIAGRFFANWAIFLEMNTFSHLLIYLNLSIADLLYYILGGQNSDSVFFYRLYSIKSYYKIKAIIPCNIKYTLDAYLFYTCVCHAESLQSCLTLCNPIHYSLPGSCVHGILQARILEYVAMPSSREPY